MQGGGAGGVRGMRVYYEELAIFFNKARRQNDFFLLSAFFFRGGSCVWIGTCIYHLLTPWGTRVGYGW